MKLKSDILFHLFLTFNLKPNLPESTFRFELVLFNYLSIMYLLFKVYAFGCKGYTFTDKKFYLLLDMQLGGSWVGEVDPSDLPVEMEIDWVRFYQKKK